MHLTASPDVPDRGRRRGRDGSAGRVDSLYKERYGSRTLTFDTGVTAIAEIADAIARGCSRRSILDRLSSATVQ